MVRFTYIKTRALFCILLAHLGAFAAAPGLTKDEAVSFEIAAGNAAESLSQFSLQSGLQMLFVKRVVDGHQTQAVLGEFEPKAALARMLEGTGLTFEFVNEKTVAVRKEGAGKESSMAMINTEGDHKSLVQLAQAGSSKASSEKSEKRSSESSTSIDKTDSLSIEGRLDERGVLDEVVVTGTHIRGAAPVGSPVLVFTHEDLERSGAATAAQFLAALPQNFGGTQNQDTLQSAVPNRGNDRTYGAAIDLRGLGASSSLVLINGRRQALAGSAEYVNISMIPLSAVERIEILTDGASAIYGSDAVGGVVNFILRKDFLGAQTRFRAGTTTQGGGEELQASQSFGAGWSVGNMLFNYEYKRQKEIYTRQRRFAANNGNGDTPFIAPSESHNVFMTVRHELSSRLRMDGDISYGRSEVTTGQLNVGDSGTDIFIDSLSQQYGGSLALSVNFSPGWNADFVNSLNKTALDSIQYLSSLPRETFGGNAIDSLYQVRSHDFKVNGDLFGLRSGMVKLAAGGGYREESYNSKSGYAVFGLAIDDNEFDIMHGFAELMIPVLGSAGVTSRPRLALSLAGRYEDYSNFGDTFNPKIGVSWAINSALQVRGSYGTSFKAPSLYQTSDSTLFYTLGERQNPSSQTGITRYVMRLGNNPQLQPETAQTWSLGLDLAPQSIPGFTVQLTYFDISYDDRILSLLGSAGILSLLTDPAYEVVRTLRGSIPDADFDARVESILTGPLTVFGCASQYQDGARCLEPPENFSAVLDAGLRNLAQTHENGIDLTFSKSMQLRGGTLSFDLNAAKLLDYTQKITVTAPQIDLLDRIYNPVDLRIRVTTAWSREAWSVGGAINYTDDYANTAVVPFERISALITADLNAGYTVSESSRLGFLNDMTAVFNVVNIFDKDPPFVSQFAGLGYDPANADPFGRVVSLTLKKSW